MTRLTKSIMDKEYKPSLLEMITSKFNQFVMNSKFIEYVQNKTNRFLMRNNGLEKFYRDEYLKDLSKIKIYL